MAKKKQVGFIAQDVQSILPDIISKGANDMLAIKTDSIIPYLVKAIQEQQEEIENLKQRINKLEK
jgi:trimeric autotransporter adhesin